MLDIENIKKTLDSSSGKALKEFLVSKLLELRNIEYVSEKDDAIYQALEVKSQKRAYKKLKDILEQVLTFSEEIKERDERDSYEIE